MTDYQSGRNWPVPHTVKDAYYAGLIVNDFGGVPCHWFIRPSTEDERRQITDEWLEDARRARESHDAYNAACDAVSAAVMAETAESRAAGVRGKAWRRTKKRALKKLFGTRKFTEAAENLAPLPLLEGPKIRFWFDSIKRHYPSSTRGTPPL